MDIESANCKLKISEAVATKAASIERPLKIEIINLKQLVEELHKAFSSEYVNVHNVRTLMEAYQSNEQDWRQYAKFDRYKYTRNLVDEGNGAFNIMILCWGPGHASAIHDHADSHCFMKMLKGTLEEVRFDWPKSKAPAYLKKHQESDAEKHHDKALEEVRRTPLRINDVCYINDTLGLHRMENQSHVDGAISLHLYCPPFNTCTIFDGRTGRDNKVKVHFHSKYGTRVRLVEDNASAEGQD